MLTFKGEGSHRTGGVASHKLWNALREVDRYLRGQSAWLVNYAERHHGGLRVGTSIIEGTAIFLLNRRLNKSHRCDGLGEAPISRSMFAEWSTTARSGQGRPPI
jgi:hypothetical protein